MFCVAWYRRDQWQRLREVSADVDELEEEYDEWLQGAQRHIERLPRGLGVKKIDVDVDELVDWCKSKGRPVDATARSVFALEKGTRPSVPGKR